MEELTREERVRQYAYTWYCFRKDNNRPGTPAQDWEKACHTVDAEDKAEIINADEKFKRRPSRMRA